MIMICRNIKTHNKMQKLIGGLPYVIRVEDCGKCHECTNARAYYGRYFPCRGQVANTYYEPYMNNMKICDQNFSRVEKINSDILADITKLNARIDNISTQLTNINMSIAGNNAALEQSKSNISIEIKTLNNSISECKTNLDATKKEIQTEMSTLGKKIMSVLRFAQDFVSKTTKWFVQTLVGIKTGTINELEFDIDNKAIDKIV